MFVQVFNASNSFVQLSAGRIKHQAYCLNAKYIYSLDERDDPNKARYRHVSLDLSSSTVFNQKNKKIIFREFLNKNRNGFANDLSELGKCNNYHTILTGTEKPIHFQPYRTSPKTKLEIEKQINQLLKCVIIEESTSAVGSSVILVKSQIMNTGLQLIIGS